MTAGTFEKFGLGKGGPYHGGGWGVGSPGPGTYIRVTLDNSLDPKSAEEEYTKYTFHFTLMQMRFPRNVLLQKNWNAVTNNNCLIRPPGEPITCVPMKGIELSLLRNKGTRKYN